MSALITISSKDQLQQELMSCTVAVMDFYADWCGPCRMVAPIMEELQEDNQAKDVKVMKVNVDENPDLADEYGVSSIPSVFFAQQGKVQEGVLGAYPKDFYQKKIDEYVEDSRKKEKDSRS